MATLAHISASDFERIAAVLGPCELVTGEVHRMAPGGVGYSKVTLRFAFALESWNIRVRHGHVLTNAAGVLVARHPDTVRGADALFISYERVPPSASIKGYLTVPAELVADPHTQTVRAYRRGDPPRAFQPTDALEGGSLLPGFRCQVADLFATA